jgi:hypothetical protein
MDRRAAGAEALPRQVKQGVFEKESPGENGQSGRLPQNQDIAVL